MGRRSTTRLTAVMRSGLCLHSVAVRGGWQRLALCFLQLMVLSFFMSKTDSPGIFRADKSGLHEELVYKSEDTNLFLNPVLLFPGGNDLLAVGFRPGSATPRLYKVNLASHEAVDLGELSGGNSTWRGPTQGNPCCLAVR